MGSGKGWTATESVAACRAYIMASEDPIAGSGKKKELFHKQILSQYKSIMEDVQQRNPDTDYVARTGDAIAQRFRKARCECLKFEAIIWSIKAKQPTGSPSEKDLQRAVQAVYNGDATIADMYTYLRDESIDLGATFPFIDCLSFLRQTIAWSMLVESKNKKRSTSVAAASENNSSAQSAGPKPNVTTTEDFGGPAAFEPKSLERQRPTGTKRALQDKQHYVVLKSGADGIARLAEASQKRNKVAEEMLAVEKQQSLVALFSMPGTNSSLRQRFIQLSQLKENALLESELRVSGGSPTGTANNVVHASPFALQEPEEGESVRLSVRNEVHSELHESVPNLASLLN